MGAKPKPAIVAEAKDEGLVDHDFVPLIVGEKYVAHGDGNYSVNLNSVFSGIVVVPDARPRL